MLTASGGGADVRDAGGGAAIRGVQQSTKTVSILGVTEDMVGAGFVDSLARPDRDTTGNSILATELDGKRPEILIEAVPGLFNLVILARFDPAELSEETRARAADGSVAYSAICTH